MGTYDRFSTDGSCLTLYVDGVKHSEFGCTNLPILLSDSSLKIGKYSSSEYFTGYIDNVNVLNYALTGAEVAAGGP